MINLIGNTPLIKLSNKINKFKNINIYVKLEYYNPSGSIKDRMIKYIFDKAIKNNEINKDSIIIEASSGNTGASIALLSNYYNLKSIICTNTKCSEEKINIMKSFKNTKLIIVSSENPNEYQNVILKMKKDNNNYYHINQYDNKLNAEAYYYTLGPEIYNECKNINYFVCAGGTGGTISGVSKYLKTKIKNLKTILVDPSGSILGEQIKNKELENKKNINTKSTLIEGIGKKNIPLAMDFDVIDDVIYINDNEIINMCYKIANLEGLIVGGSGGANILGALKLAEIINNNNNNNTINIVTIVPDTGLKYMSKIYNPEWLKSNNLEIEI